VPPDGSLDLASDEPQDHSRRVFTRGDTYLLGEEPHLRAAIAAMVLDGDLPPNTPVRDPASGAVMKAGDLVETWQLRALFEQAIQEHFRPGYLSEAERVFQLVCEVTGAAEKIPNVYCYLGLIQFRRGELFKARMSFERATDAQDPVTAALGRNNLGVVSALEGDMTRARELLKQARGGGFAAPYLNLAFVQRLPVRLSRPEAFRKPGAPKPRAETEEAAAPEAEDVSEGDERKILLQNALERGSQYQELALMFRDEIGVHATDKEAMANRASVEGSVSLACKQAAGDADHPPDLRKALTTIRLVLADYPEASDRAYREEARIFKAWLDGVLDRLCARIHAGDVEGAATTLMELKEFSPELHDKWARQVAALRYAVEMQTALDELRSGAIAKGLALVRSAVAFRQELPGAEEWQVEPEEFGRLALLDAEHRRALDDALAAWAKSDFDQAEELLSGLATALASANYKAPAIDRLLGVARGLRGEKEVLAAEDKARTDAWRKTVDQNKEVIEKAGTLYVEATDAFNSRNLSAAIPKLHEAIATRKEAGLTTQDWDRLLSDWTRQALTQAETILVPHGQLEAADALLTSLSQAELSAEAARLQRLRDDITQRRERVALDEEARRLLATVRPLSPAQAYRRLKALPHHLREVEVIRTAILRYYDQLSPWQRILAGPP